jgi:hypothetical protein
MFEASLGKKFSKSHLKQWLGVVTHACHLNYTEKHKEEDHNQSKSGHKVRLYLKNNQS